MQNARACTKYVRIPPRKARLAADLIRGLNVEDAVIQLMYSQLKGGKLLKKTLDSAVANAETQLNVPRQKLMVKEVRVDAGPVLKRSKSKARGGMVAIMKRTSHFTVIVEPQSESDTSRKGK
ncbi:MAG: 50S ribosomal protein L22 [Verrucomicrobia bacterium]|nr:50S ribosomal protein L22 [Verrucomicrobiota bacterium]